MIEVAMDARATGGAHVHPGGEQLLMLTGTAQIGEHLLGPGDVPFTPPGAVHRAHAVTDCRFLLLLPEVPVSG